MSIDHTIESGSRVLLGIAALILGLFVVQQVWGWVPLLVLGAWTLVSIAFAALWALLAYVIDKKEKP